MFSAPIFLLGGIATLVAVSTAAPAGKEMQWIHGHWVPNLDTCQKSDHVEQFNDDEDEYGSAPAHGPFVYERFGIGYINLAQVNMNEQFKNHPHMVPAPKDDDKHGVAAIGAATRPDGHALDRTIGYLALRPSSKVHAFKVKKLSFFCLQHREPASCTIGFRISPATWETQAKVSWEGVGLDGAETSTYAASWGSPRTTVEFRNMPVLQAFSIGLPIPKLDSWDNSTTTVDKLDKELNSKGITAYIDSIEFTTWECDEELPNNPMGGAMKRIMATGFLP